MFDYIILKRGYLYKYDDLCKVLVVDHVIKNTRKIKNWQNIPSIKCVEYQSKKICEEYFKNGNIEKTKSDLLEIAKKQQLFCSFSIPCSKWLNNYLSCYLIFLHPQLNVKLVECNRYLLDSYNGVAVVARKDFPANTIIGNLFGVYRDLTSTQEEMLKSQQADFSLLQTSSSRKSKIMLGSLAFVNHDCNPNCRYLSKSKGWATLITIKHIQANEELFVYYSDSYFGNNNCNCECKTCEKNKIGK